MSTSWIRRRANYGICSHAICLSSDKHKYRPSPDEKQSDNTSHRARVQAQEVIRYCGTIAVKPLATSHSARLAASALRKACMHAQHLESDSSSMRRHSGVTVPTMVVLTGSIVRKALCHWRQNDEIGNQYCS